MKGFGTIRQKLLHCNFLLLQFMFHNEILAGKRCSSPSSCCLQEIRFPWAQNGISRVGPRTRIWHCCHVVCAESLQRLVQQPLSPLPGQANLVHAGGAATSPFLTVTLPPHLPNPRTWKSNFLRHPRGIPTRGRLGSFPIEI